MNKSDVIEFKKIISGLSALYGKSLDAVTINFYWDTLADFSLADISRAVKVHLQNPDSGQFMPKPADLIKYLHGDTKTQSLIAWSRVRRMVSRVGGYQSIEFEDKFSNQVIYDMGGWVKLCLMDEKKIDFYENEFLRRYQSYLISPRECDVKFLPGLFYNENARFGNDEEKVLFIANDEKLVEKKISFVPQLSVVQNEQEIERELVATG